MTTTAATDAELVVWAQQGDLDAFGALYERHFHLIHDYVARLAQDPMLAADVTRDTFVTAVQQIGQLNDPERFRAWLYTIARKLAIERMEQEKALDGVETGVAGAVQPELQIVVDLDAVGDDHETEEMSDIAELVWAAATTLEEPKFTVLDLTTRHQLTSSELGDITGVDTEIADATVNTLMERASDEITTYLVMRLGTEACDRLSAIVGDNTAPPDSIMRARVRRHVSSCETCSETKNGLASPPQVIAALATIAAPEIVYEKTWENIAGSWPTEQAGSGRRGVIRASVLAGALTLLLALGVAGAVQVNNSLQPEAADVGTPEDGGLSPGEEGAGPVALAFPTSTTTTVSTSTTLATTTTGPQTSTTVVTPPPLPTSTTSTTSTTTPTTSTTAPTTTLPANQAPTVTILAPSGGQHFKSSKPLAVTLEATVSDDYDFGLTVEWFEGSTSLGSGNTLTFTFSRGCPDPVSHTVTARATDSSGLSGIRTVTFTVGCGPEN